MYMILVCFVVQPQIYDRLDDDKLTANFVQEEFSSDFPDADTKLVFADDSVYDEARKVF